MHVGNYATILEDDIAMMWVFRNRVAVNWPWFFTEKLLRCKRKEKADIPYAVLISAFLLHLGYNENTTCIELDVNNQFGSSCFSLMGIKKVNNLWCYANVTPPAPPIDEMEAELNGAFDAFRGSICYH